MGRHPRPHGIRWRSGTGFRIERWGAEGTSGKPMTGSGETKFPPKFSAWRRIVVKLSGEALMGAQTHGLDQDTLARIAADLKEVAARGVEAAVVVGGGN